MSTYYVYDKTGRLIAEVSHAGWLTEYRYDSLGRTVAVLRYATALGASVLAVLADPNSNVEMASIRPAFHPADICTWQVYDKEGRLTSTIDGSGGVATMDYDASGQLVRTVHHHNKLSAAQVAALKSSPPTAAVLPAADSRDSVARNFYDKDGRILAVLDGEGYLTRSVYDRAGQKVEDIAYLNPTNAAYRASGTLDQLLATLAPHADDRRIRYSYDGRGALRYQIDGFNQVTEFAYDNVGRVTTVIAYAGSIAATGDYSFDNVKYLVSVSGLGSSPANRRTWTVYDDSGRAAYTIDAEDQVTQLSYDAMGQVTKSVRFAAKRTTTWLPSRYDMDSWASGQSGNGANRVERYFYSARGELRFAVDAEGYVSRSDFDAAGRTLREVRWDTAIALWDGATIDNVNAMATGNWVETRYAYNVGGELTDVWNGENNHVRYNYHATGKLASTIVGDSDPSTSYFEYDAAGQLVAQYDAWGTADELSIRYTYDGHGNAVSVTDARGQVTTRAYDRMGRVLTESDALGGIVRYEYDAFGDAVKVTDARGNSSYSYYDRLGRITAHRDAEDYVTQTSYNAFGEMIAVTRRYNRASNAAGTAAPPVVAAHAKDATTLFEVDRLGRAVKATDAEGHYEQFTFDAFGNRISVRNKLGGIVTNAYDRRGLLVAETLPMASVNDAGTVLAYSVTNRFEYDSRGNRTRSIEAFGLPEQRTTTFVYDKANRLIETRGDAVSVISQGDHNSVSTVTPTERLRYDERGRLVETIDALGARTLLYYDKLDRKTVEIGAAGTYSTYAYDRNGNLTATRIYAAAVSQPAQAGGAAPAAPGGEYRETTFTYDSLNRLKTSSVANIRTGAWNGSSYATSLTTLTNSFDYDSNGNVIKTTDNRGATVYTYYDRSNRAYASIDQEDYLTVWTRDSEGNVLTERRHAQRAYYPNVMWPTYVPTDPADRVTSFTYDRNGRRLTETRENVLHASTAGPNQISTATGSATISYAYNGLGLVTRRTEATGEFVDYA
ncbi:MAG TPA: hypothetical protein VEA60_12220, partial [Allosphingosinicella sp.]|nr:hypothetical protein [Allosphingosinicella sp.]